MDLSALDALKWELEFLKTTLSCGKSVGKDANPQTVNCLIA